MKKLILLICIFFAVNNIAHAQEFKDMVSETHWAYTALKYVCDNGYIQGFDDSTIRPDAPLTRAQLATIIVRIYGNGNKANISDFKDVSESAWYYEAFCEAVHMKLFQGNGTNHLYPDNNVTRQETFVVIGRLLQLALSEGNTKFNDDADIAEWSKGYINALIENGYISGDDNNCVKPKDEITRAEFSQLIYNININQNTQADNAFPVDSNNSTSSGKPSIGGGSFNEEESNQDNSENNKNDTAESVLFDGDSYEDDIFDD